MDNSRDWHNTPRRGGGVGTTGVVAAGAGK